MSSEYALEQGRMEGAILPPFLYTVLIDGLACAMCVLRQAPDGHMQCTGCSAVQCARCAPHAARVPTRVLTRLVAGAGSHTFFAIRN